MTEGIYLLLGSNMGDKRQQLSVAISKIAKSNQIIKQSGIYETAAWGNTNQPSFYNQVIQINTPFTPFALLTYILNVEQRMGRVRKEKWGQRAIDIDILYYNNLAIKSDHLIIPHTEIQNRRFTLIPLNEIAAELRHPLLQKSQRELLNNCLDTLEVSLVKNIV